MEKIRTTVKIAGKDYTISSYDGEEYVQRVAAYVDGRMSDLSAATGLPAGQLAVLAAISVTDDMLKAREETARLRRELDKALADMEEMKKAREQ